MVNPNTALNQKHYSTPNAKKAIEVKSINTPIHCPTEGSSLWNSHPQVYIPVVENGGTAICPYCGTTYKIID
ncbi:MAG: zinc-finger domain-containing protein [Gammaproteobacteria bacterium]|nr:zinc-finger domain-containing protein [Gammaproteobacteria bacterium]